MTFTGKRPETGSGTASGDDDIEARDFTILEWKGDETVVTERRGDVNTGWYSEGRYVCGGEEGRLCP